LAGRELEAQLNRLTSSRYPAEELAPPGRGRATKLFFDVPLREARRVLIDAEAARITKATVNAQR
jgi:hypothetical protein